MFEDMSGCQSPFYNLNLQASKASSGLRHFRGNSWGDNKNSFGRYVLPWRKNSWYHPDIKRHLSLESRSTLSKRSSSTINSSALAGGLIGGVVVLSLVILLTVIWIRRRQSKTKMAPSTLFKATHVLDIRASSPHCQRGSQYIDLYPDKAPSQVMHLCFCT